MKRVLPPGAIVSTTLCGPAHVGKIHLATDSVPWTDARIVIDTTTEPMSLVASAAMALDVRLERWLWPTPPHYGNARNAALGFATAHGARWALTVDADERIHCPDPDALRAFLASTDADCVEARVAGDDYVKPRLIRLPAGQPGSATGRWVGPAHEYFTARRTVTTELLTVTELPHTQEELEAKWRRNVAALTPIADESPRWAYYLGRAHWGLGQHELAVHYYALCAERSQKDEEVAWARFEGACVLQRNLGRDEEAIRWCALGLARHAGFGELCWLAAVASRELGRREQARCWAELARVHHGGSEAARRRRGFRSAWGLGEGPAAVLRGLWATAAALFPHP